MTRSQEKRAPQLIQPIERNANGIKTTHLELPSVRPFYRRVNVTLTTLHLTVSVYTSGVESAAFASRPISEWHLNVDKEGGMCLWCGLVAFGLSRNEGASIRAWLEPLGLEITRYA